MTNTIRQIIEQHGRLPVPVTNLSDQTDLYQAGMTSHASVSVMLALENEFNIEFPDHMLKRSAFESVDAIKTAVETLVAQAV